MIGLALLLKSSSLPSAKEGSDFGCSMPIQWMLDAAEQRCQESSAVRLW